MLKRKRESPRDLQHVARLARSRRDAALLRKCEAQILEELCADPENAVLKSKRLALAKECHMDKVVDHIEPDELTLLELRDCLICEYPIDRKNVEHPAKMTRICVDWSAENVAEWGNFHLAREDMPSYDDLRATTRAMKDELAGSHTGVHWDLKAVLSCVAVAGWALRDLPTNLFGQEPDAWCVFDEDQSRTRDAWIEAADAIRYGDVLALSDVLDSGALRAL